VNLDILHFLGAYSMQSPGISVFCAIISLMALLPSSPGPAEAQSAASSTKFAALSDRFMKESLALSPTSASAAGYHVHVDPRTGKKIELDAELDDLSLKAMDEQRAFYVRWRQRFRSETPLAALNPQDAADWSLIDDQISLNLLEFDESAITAIIRPFPSSSSATRSSCPSRRITPRSKPASATCFRVCARSPGCSIR
jgi:hypothetical protein